MAPRQTSTALPQTCTRSLLVLILLADTPVPPVKAAHGNYLDIFTTLFRNSLALDGKEGGKEELVCESYDVVEGVYPSETRLKEADAVLITGSASSSYLPTSWITALVTYTSSIPNLAPSAKIFGICFGHQILARAFGSTVEKNSKGWEIGVRSVELSEVGKEVMGGDILKIHQMHQDHVVTLPTGWTSLGSTPVCPIQGMVLCTPPSPSVPFSLDQISIISFQGHPEFSTDIVNKIIDVRAAGGVFPPPLVEVSRGFAGESDEGVRIGRVLMSILGV